MNTKIRQGRFEIIDSFAIRRRNEFYLIGKVTEGTIQENWFINIGLNQSLSLTLRISAIEDIEISSEDSNYQLLIISCEDGDTDLLLGMRIGSENADITIEGAD